MICKRFLIATIEAFIQPDYYVISYVGPYVISEVTARHQASCDDCSALTASVGLCSPQNWDLAHPHFPSSSSSGCLHWPCHRLLRSCTGDGFV